MPAQDVLIVESPRGRRYRIDLWDSVVTVYDDAGRRQLRVKLNGMSVKAMVRRIRENIQTGAPAYLAAWPPKDVDRILTCHAIACER